MISQRGGDFLLETGQDLSVGYDSHDADLVQPLHPRELQLPGRDARGSRRARALIRARNSATVLAYAGTLDIHSCT